MKTCTECRIEKSLDNFFKQKSSINGNMQNNKYQKLKQAVRKAIKPACEVCGGRVVYRRYHLSGVNYNKINCLSCNGKGYIEELELNECGHCGFSVECDTCGTCIQKNNLTLQEILLALGRKEDINIKFGYTDEDTLIVKKHGGRDLFEVPINQTPDQYNEELLDKLIEMF